MTRSVWKGPFVDPSFFRSTQIKRKVWSRRSCILPQFVGSFTQIYNGKKWIGLKIRPEMVGHKFGEFASTRINRSALDTAGTKNLRLSDKQGSKKVRSC